MNDMEKIIYEKGNDQLVYNEETKDLIWIKDDTVNYIEKTNDLKERQNLISYFSKLLPTEAMSYVENKLEGII